MYILGISCYFHDSSATLLKDGAIVAQAQEERFTRIKHDSNFPINAIKFCLEFQNISIDDIEYIGFYEKPLLKFERIMAQHVTMFPKSYRAFLSSVPNWISTKLKIRNILKKELKYKKNVLFIPHHLSHAASSFFVSPFKKSTILVVDGVGEWSTTTLGLGINNKIDLYKEIKFPNSVGLLYSAITSYLGFRVNNSEFKVMGLSGYGNKNRKTNKFYEKLKSIISQKNDGSFCIDMTYFTYIHKTSMVSNKLEKLLEGPIRKKSEPITSRHNDIAAAIQMIAEDLVFGMLDELYRLTKCKTLTYSGGLALNSVINGLIQQKTKFEKVWIQPDAGDSGGSLGAAAYIYYSILKNKRKYVQTSTYFGPGFKTSQIKNFLIKNNINFVEYNKDSDLTKDVAKYIFNDKIIGWFQGKMESGPRALGNRSILANPLNNRIKDKINSKVKFREMFRPFAPVIRTKDIDKFIKQKKKDITPAKFMLMVLDFKKKWHKILPSVVHVDGTGRFQILDKDINSKYYNLITQFEKLSGVPILLNTSLNVRGEPICCNFKEAYRCFNNTGIDYLVMGNFLIKKNKNK